MYISINMYTYVYKCIHTYTYTYIWHMAYAYAYAYAYGHCYQLLEIKFEGLGILGMSNDMSKLVRTALVKDRDD